MFIIYAYNHIGTGHFEMTVLEEDYALTIYETAKKCIDCESTYICDALTGEVLREWSHKGTETIYNS